MIGRMPAARARATASFASARGGSIMPIRPRNTRSCSTPFVDRRRRRTRRRAASGRRRRACAAPRRRAARWRSRICRAALVGQRPRLVADQLVRAAREQDVRRALGEDEQALLLLGVACGPCSSACARTRTAPRRRARSARRARRASRPALRAATSSAPSVGSPCTVQRPSRSCRTALLARSAGAQRALDLDAQRAVDRRRRPSRSHARPRARSRCRRSRPGRSR